MLPTRLHVCVTLGLILLYISNSLSESESTSWWKNGVFYQIYPRSFKDSNNDGIGDLQGIISKLDHLKDAGITATWLSPIFKSPQKDMGYDISDYRDISPEYGTIADLDKLIEEAHKRGIKIILDFVPNHSSDQHEWFKKSANNEAGYEDYYVWVDANKTTNSVPNNWVSIFRGSAWTYSEKRNQYYLHQFAEAQPDFNFRNPKVVQELDDILIFWLDRGVDGFRVDAVPFLLEDNKWLDEPLSGDKDDPNDYGYLNHIYTFDQDGTFDLVYHWREVIDKYNKEHNGDDRVLLTEAYTDINHTMLYYGDAEGKRLGSHVSFNFFFITDLGGNSKAKDIVNVVNKWMNNMPTIYTANWVLGNHDQYRMATRLGVDNVDGFHMLVACLPGVGVTYNGEEIGQENGEVKFEEGQDPTAMENETIFEQNSRDFERTPFHWDNTTNAGFNEGFKPWLPVSKKHKETNLAFQKVSGVKSHYKIYRDLLKLRKQNVLKDGKLTITALSENVISLTRSLPNMREYVFVFNIGGKQETVNLTASFNTLSKIDVVVSSVKSKRNKGDVLEVGALTLDPHESLIGISSRTGSTDWWKHAVIYQIYPRSFKDGDNNGIGDLKGIISKLDHLVDAGIKAVWLSPINKSPQVDQGYDISDYRDIDPIFGTLADYELLLQEAHKRGLKIILDFVPNHTSDKHEWFIKSENAEAGYENFYVWVDAKEDGSVPNNWLSSFKGSAWEWSSKRKQYYLHQFAKEQADLNYRDPQVVKEMKDVLKFWLDKGVDGFRTDVANLLFEDINLPDEPLSNVPGFDPDDHGYLKHIYTSDQKETYDMVYQWRELMDAYQGDERILLTEAYTDIEHTVLFYGNSEEDRLGSHIPFNFFFITDLAKGSAENITKVINLWLSNMPKQYVPNWVLGNHDQHRIASRFHVKNVDGFNMLVALLPGVQITYNGEEIGQEDGEVTFEEGADPHGCKNESIFDKVSRDFERTPFHWDDSVNAGFNEGYKTWLPVSKKYKETNLANQKRAGVKSHYHIYQNLTKLRQNKVLQSGSLEVTAKNDVLILTRNLESITYILTFNPEETNKIVNVTEINKTYKSVQIVLSSVESEYEIGKKYCLDSLKLLPHESLVGLAKDEKCAAATISIALWALIFSILSMILY